jgi:hypothetical protein
VRSHCMTGKAKRPRISSPPPAPESPSVPAQSGNNSEPEPSSTSEIEEIVVKESRTRDIDEFFAPTELRGPKGNQKRQRRCLRCKTEEK